MTAAALLRVLVLAAHAHAAWPTMPIERVVRASYVAVATETDAVPAEILLAIAEHESDLRPNVVSYCEADGHRVDILWEPVNSDLGPDVFSSTKVAAQARANAQEKPGPEASRRKVAGWWPRGAVCGYLAATLDRASCDAAIVQDGGMSNGAEQLVTWSRFCRSDLRCALAGYAGGVAGARAAREGRVTLATRFADLFIARARRLGVVVPRS